MHRYFLIVIGFLLVLSKITLADPGPTYDILLEYFENEFPPSGWTLVKTNPDNTWVQTETAFDGRLKGFYHFAFVQGDNSHLSDELLISPQLNDAPGYMHNLYFHFYYYFFSSSNLIAFALDDIDAFYYRNGKNGLPTVNCFTTEKNNIIDDTIGERNTIKDAYKTNGYRFTIEFSRRPYPDWDVFRVTEIIRPSANDFKWDEYYICYDYFHDFPTPFWIGFRFKGGENHLVDDDIIDDDTIGDDESNDDMTNDDQSDDDDVGHNTSDDDDSRHGCGCSMASANTDVSLFLTMFLIGIGAWIVGNKRK